MESTESSAVVLILLILVGLPFVIASPILLYCFIILSKRGGLLVMGALAFVILVYSLWVMIGSWTFGHDGPMAESLWRVGQFFIYILVGGVIYYPELQWLARWAQPRFAGWLFVKTKHDAAAARTPAQQKETFQDDDSDGVAVRGTQFIRALAPVYLVYGVVWFFEILESDYGEAFAIHGWESLLWWTALVLAVGILFMHELTRARRKRRMALPGDAGTRASANATRSEHAADRCWKGCR